MGEPGWRNHMDWDDSLTFATLLWLVRVKHLNFYRHWMKLEDAFTCVHTKRGFGRTFDGGFESNLWFTAMLRKQDCMYCTTLYSWTTCTQSVAILQCAPKLSFWQNGGTQFVHLVCDDWWTSATWMWVRNSSCLQVLIISMTLLVVMDKV